MDRKEEKARRKPLAPGEDPDIAGITPNVTPFAFTPRLRQQNTSFYGPVSIC